MTIEIKNEHLKQLLDALAESMSKEVMLPENFYLELQNHPEYGLEILNLFPTFDEEDEDDPYIMACFHYIELCLVHLRLAREHQQRWAEKLIDMFQHELIHLMTHYPKVNYWMPIINLFFEADIELNDQVKSAYLNILEESQRSEESSLQQQILMQQLLSEKSDASEFEIAELFFAQTSALPLDYFPAFVNELLNYELPKALNTSTLFFLHPLKAVRLAVFEHAEKLFGNVKLPEASISRLPLIRQWLPDNERGYIDSILANQRKQGATFAEQHYRKIVEVKATEMDGSGAQALFFLIKNKDKSFQTAGVLVKKGFGIKDTWISPHLTRLKAQDYASQGMTENIILRKVDENYSEKLIAHHIYHSLNEEQVPSVNLLKLQEMTGLSWQPNPLNFKLELKKLGESLDHLSDNFIKKSLQRSSKWHKNQVFTESWFEEDAELDKYVNKYCTFVDGTKYCELEKALPDIMSNYLEPKREKWFEHFIWMALWAKPKARYNEYLWKDCYILAKLISEGTPLTDIPLMTVICEESVLLSLETMEYRKTHLS